MKLYDIVIIGLGPAGSILASGIKNKSILVIDKKNPSNPNEGFNKPCGGLLAPDAQKELAELSLHVPKHVLVDPQIFSVETIDFDHDLINYYQRMYLNINRHAFDLWLMNNIPDYVEKAYSSTVISLDKNENDKYIINYRNQRDETFSCTADMIVGADGASSIVRRYVYPKAKYRYYTAIQQWFNDLDKKPMYSCIFDSMITDCYSWRISKDGKLIVGGAYASKNSRASFEEQKKKISAKFNVDLSNSIKTESCLVMRPKSFKHFFLGKDNVFLVGEAAGLVSPSSLEGISHAIKSAVALTSVFNGKDQDLHKKYKKATQNMRVQLYLKNIKSLFIYKPFLRKLVMKSGIKSIKVKEIK